MAASDHSRRKLPVFLSGFFAAAALAGYMVLRGAALIPAATPSPDAASRAAAPDAPRCGDADQRQAREDLRSAERKDGPESQAAADAMDALIACLLSTPERATAEDLALVERDLRLTEKLRGAVTDQAALRHAQAADIQWRFGKYIEALPHARSAYEIQTRLHGASSRQAIDSIYEYAETHRLAGNFSEAIKLHTQGLAMREGLGETESPGVAGVLHYLGVLWSNLGDDARARPLIERSLAMRERTLGTDDRLVAVSLNTLGNIVSHAGDPETAMKLYIRAQRVWEKAEGASHPDVARSLNNQGFLLAEAGRFDEAEALLARGLEIRERAFGADNYLVARSLVYMADLRARKGDLAGAETLFNRAVAIEKKYSSGISREASSTLAGRASLKWAMGKFDEAMADSLTAEAISRKLFLQSSAGLTEAESLTYEATRTSGLDVALSVVAMRAEKNGPGPVQGVERVWDEVILSQALVLDLLAGDPRPDADPHRRTARVAAALPERSALIVYLRYERHVESKRADTIPSYLAMVLEPRLQGESPGAPLVVPLGPVRTIDRLIQEWRREVSRDPRLETAWDATRAYRLAGGRLREAIWDPISPALVGAQTVFVVPDGAINLVSLATLPSTIGKYMIETDPTIHYLSAARDLDPPGPRSPAGSGVLVMGGADYENSTGPHPIDHETGESPESWACHPESASMKFSSLPESLTEAQEVASRLRMREDVTLVTGADAGECAFKRLAPGRRILHLATHGFFFPGGCTAAPGDTDMARESPGHRESPLSLSGLAMAGANRRPADGAGRDADEGILMADEIASVDLSSVEWVVLSGCQTGVGEILDGEGVLGLRRAFQIAGARTLIMSLWPVEDSAARIWMRRLYDNRLAGRATAASVANASLDLLAEQRAAGRTTHPYFWGAFVAVGEWK